MFLPHFVFADLAESYPEQFERQFASETKGLLAALLPVVKQVLDTTEEHHQHMVSALAAMVSLVDLFDDSGMFLDKRIYTKARKLGQDFFSSYSWLNKWAEAEKQYLLHLQTQRLGFEVVDQEKDP